MQQDIHATPANATSHRPPSGRRPPYAVAFLLSLATVASACSNSDNDEAVPTASAADTVPPTASATAPTAPAATLPPPETTTLDDVSPEPSVDPGVPELLDVQVASGIVPIAVYPNGPTPALPAGAVERIVELDGQEIFTIEIPGEGPPIMLLHGFPDHLSLYDELFPLLAGRRVIAFDFIGWGRSSKPLPAVEYDFTTAAQVDQLEAVIDAYGLSDITLVVHDQSAPVGLEYLLRTEALVGEMVFMNGFFMASPNLSPPKGIELHSDPRLQAAELAVEADPAAVTAFHRFQMDEFIEISPNEAVMIDKLNALFAEARPAFVAMTDILIAEVIDRTSRVDQLAEITTPIDIVQGARDPYLTTELALEFDEIFAQSTLTLIDDAGHFPQIDAPDIVAAAILQRNS